MANLELRIDKPENVYQFIFDWQAQPSAHGKNILYLFLHALVQWGTDRNNPVVVFVIVMQYSPTLGHNVDLTQPAHILEEDAPLILERFEAFVTGRRGLR